MKIKRIYRPVVARILASVITGVLLATAYPPFESPEAAWIGLIPLLLLCRWTRPGQCFYLGLLTGLCFWLISLSWLLSLHDTWGYLPMVALAWIALSFYCALFFAFFAWLSSHAIRRWPVSDSGDAGHGGVGWFHSSVRGLGVMAAVTAFWVGLEFFRSVLFSGFPWNGLGVSQYQKIAFIQFAEIGGVYLVSGLMVFVNAAIALTTIRIVVRCRSRGSSRGMHLELMVGLLAWLFFWFFGVRMARMNDRNMMREPEAHITCVQPGISQDKKWSGRPDYVLKIYDKLEHYTQVASIGKPDLVIWPETSVPGYLGVESSFRDEYAMDFVKNLSREFGPILAGAMEAVPRGGENLYYNSSFLFDRLGDIQNFYRKKHLVPFGEYIPLENVVPLVKRFAPWDGVARQGRQALYLNWK
ncbi:MAG: apolipoprotein N-acyltransferase [Verrucomicrobiota bacterium]